MTNQLTKTKIGMLCANYPNPEKLAAILNNKLSLYDIITRDQTAGFIAQCGHESVDFTRLEENLNYSGDRLWQVFPRHFKNKEEAYLYHRKPEMIANRVYADRMGNGNEASGDGWRYRGRGAIQLTGRYNYELFGEYIKRTPADAAEYCNSIEGAVESACWYWQTNHLNKYADSDDIAGMTRRINGGTHGLEERSKRYEFAKQVLAPTGLLARGIRGA